MSSSSRCWSMKSRSSRRSPRRPRRHRQGSRRWCPSAGGRPRCPAHQRDARASGLRPGSRAPRGPPRPCTRRPLSRPRSSRSCRSARRRLGRLPRRSAPSGRPWWRCRRSSSSPTSIRPVRRPATRWTISPSPWKTSRRRGDSSRPGRTRPSRRRGVRPSSIWDWKAWSAPQMRHPPWCSRTSRPRARHPRSRTSGAGLAMRAPAAAPPPAPPPAARVKRTAPKDAKMKVRDEAAAAGDFVDLSAMILEEEPPARDTRMKIADEEPTGDEEKDFQEMLTRFKQGIDENIDEADFQSHYDLGVAFKEMGLLDEAIAELQKALRAPEGKLRTSEALGVCFLEKGAYVVAESILRRGLELPASGDQERLGVLYWLGRALEEQGKKVEARELYGRVFAVDIRFKDVGERSRALAKAK